ncbi:hypothetical protein M405DRAFT_843450 [Rhizopogon salebrosus TDB-379]|nr:hypothetical protein M405DRAFT_843450 [Rhizopogon salebrosus TDB-379]
MWERTLQDLIRSLRANKNDECKPTSLAMDEIRRDIKSKDMELKVGVVMKLAYGWNPRLLPRKHGEAVELRHSDRLGCAKNDQWSYHVSYEVRARGMGLIAATLRCYFEPQKVYAAFVRLLDTYSMHAIFYPGPDLFIAMAVAIVWVYRGMSFQFLQRYLTFPIAYYIDHITSGSANVKTALSLLSSFFVPEDDDALLSWIEQMLGDKKLRSQIAQWRQDWVQLVASGRDGDALS